MWHIALLAVCAVAAVFLAAMLSAIRGVDRALKQPASRERTRLTQETASAVEEAGQVAPSGKGDVNAAPGVRNEPAADAGTVADARQNVPPPKELWVDSEYCWVVICKNHSFHRHPNLYNVHRIPLGQTDAVTPRPPIQRAFSVQCDECKKEYFYKPSEVLRWEMEAPPSFVPHALFK